jgi:hypothetical protein
MASFAPIAAMIGRNLSTGIEGYVLGFVLDFAAPSDDRWRRTTKFANGSAEEFQCSGGAVITTGTGVDGRHRHARTHAIENEQTDRGRQIALLPLGVDVAYHGRQRHLLIVRNFLQPEPEWFFQTYTGLMTANDNGTFHDE